MNLKDLTEQFQRYVTLDRFTPVERIVYGATGIILIGAMTAIVSLVIKK